jgi:hypothetical protein
MGLVAMLKANDDLSEVCNTLKLLDYKVQMCETDRKESFIYAERKAGSDLRNDLLSVKQSCKLKGSIRYIYGSTTGSV